ncbi:MAG: hypothetical protein K0S70_1006 [Microbacterium sp.]|jgi:hypothetical protein|nr:hypothetical protein [Microbacterium sp.]
MTNLEVQLPAVPSAPGEPTISIVHAHYVQRAFELADQVLTDASSSKREIALARSVASLADAVHEIVGGLHAGRIAVDGFPGE